MNYGLFLSASGVLNNLQRQDVIANNLANINTTGFKRDRANFEDLFYRNEVLPGALDADGNPTPTGISTGLGVRLSSVQTDYRQGAFEQTGKELDMAIEGAGFFQVTDLGGEILYTRSGNFSVNANGQLVMGSANTGRLVEPAITFPEDTVGIVVSADGRVQIRQAGSPNLSEIGQLTLALFVNPGGLLKLGENLYAETDASFTPTLGVPGENGLGQIRQGVLETSNVQPVRELIDLITTQRSFELNSQTVQAGDEMLQLIANLGRL